MRKHIIQIFVEVFFQSKRYVMYNIILGCVYMSALYIKEKPSLKARCLHHQRNV